MSEKNIFIRLAQPSDAPAITRIAFLTADSGKSAEGKMNMEELPGLIFVLPYITPLPDGGRIKGTAGFALVERRAASSGPAPSGNVGQEGEDVEYEENVVGYTLLAADSSTYRDTTEKYWWPSLRAQYPHWQDIASNPEKATALDALFVDRIHHPKPYPPDCLSFSPAHMHINILPEYQGQGWGRRLVRALVEHARSMESLEGVFLGYFPDNLNAAKFYHRIGFRHEHVNGAPENYCGLKFDEFA